MDNCMTILYYIISYCVMLHVILNHLILHYLPGSSRQPPRTRGSAYERSTAWCYGRTYAMTSINVIWSCSKCPMCCIDLCPIGLRFLAIYGNRLRMDLYLPAQALNRASRLKIRRAALGGLRERGAMGGDRGVRAGLFRGDAEVMHKPKSTHVRARC